MRGSVLSFGASGSAVVQAVFGSILALGVGALIATSSSDGATINGHVVEHPGVLLLIGAGLCIAGPAFVVSTFLTGVRADEHGVHIRRAWRAKQIPWDQVVDIRAHETVPLRWSTLAGPDMVTVRMRPVASWSVGVVELREGTIIRLPGFIAAARKEGLSLGTATATELKVQALARYRATITGVPQMSPTSDVPTPLEDDPPSRRWMVSQIGAAIALWSVVSWAAGTFMSPVFLVVAVAPAVYRLIMSRRYRVG